jgi:hypothetical protein
MRLHRSLLCLALAITPSTTSAQSYTGTIVGSVKDSSGAVLPHATVTITNRQTDQQASVNADLEGRYASLPLPPGQYRIEVGVQGFRRAARAVTVQINTTVVIDFTLEVGALTDAVEVRADATPLETTTGTVGRKINEYTLRVFSGSSRIRRLSTSVAGSIGNNYNSMSYTVNGARPYSSPVPTRA